MSAPEYVPHGLVDRPRRGEPLPAPRGWVARRPGDLPGRQPAGPKFGSPGPDQGYVLRLLPLFDDRLLAGDHHRHDVDAGAVAVALKRASIFGRAPVVHDLEVGYRVWGFLDEPAAELVSARRDLFDGADHSYRKRRQIAASVPQEALRLPPGVVAERHRTDWRSLLAT